MIVRTDLEGHPTDGGRASTETLMHTAVYRRRADVHAVVHAHPPTATGVRGGRHRARPPAHRGSGGDPRAGARHPYGQPSTEELADNVGRAICDAQALLMANHGALAVGDTLERAWERMETLEQLARVTLVTRLLGGDHLLPGREVGRLEESRTRSGYPPPVCDPLPGAAGLARGHGPAPAGRVTVERNGAREARHGGGGALPIVNERRRRGLDSVSRSVQSRDGSEGVNG
jgi:L-fuculose-phosphate aldolase